jgi:hypothetical protein
MMIDNTRRIEIDDLEKSRTRQRLKKFIDQLKEKARDGTLECCAIRLHMKDGTSPIVVIGGTVEEQAAARAHLETMEAEIETQKAQCCSIMEEIFPQLPEEERRWILESPERMRIAFNTLSDAQRTKLSSLSQECFMKYLALLEDLSASALLGRGAIGFLR